MCKFVHECNDNYYITPQSGIYVVRYGHKMHGCIFKMIHMLALVEAKMEAVFILVCSSDTISCTQVHLNVVLMMR